MTSTHRSFRAELRAALAEHRPALREAALVSFFMALLSLGISMFSMQVYDRVIPTHGTHTLAVLAGGVALAIALEALLKHARAQLMDHAVTGLDRRLSRDIFERLLALRIDQMPASVGSLAAQVRGYESVRGFYTAQTLFTLVDLPMGLVFLGVVGAIGSPWIAAVPLAFGMAGLAQGLLARRRIQRLAAAGAEASHRKTGLLVEVVEGAETIKSAAGGDAFLARWLAVNGEAIDNDLRMKRAHEGISHTVATLQQLGYAGVIVAGSLLVMAGDMTTGALIACSILGSRVLGPLLMLPGLIAQHASARAAIDSLEKLYQLGADLDAVAQPLAPSALEPSLDLRELAFRYGDAPQGVQVQQLVIRSGERVAIVGPIGAGKSTLLRLMAGLYRPQQGRVLVGGLDAGQLARTVLARDVAYLQQEHRLFQGTLRENLLVGLPDPGDDALNAALRRSGLIDVVAAHPRGLDLPIFEGGKGLSGGQRQLVAFTRLLLGRARLLLLDEPSANMDASQERRCLQIVRELADEGRTLVVVTHRPQMLALVDRVIVVAGHRVALDGPREAILARLAASDSTRLATE